MTRKTLCALLLIFSFLFTHTIFAEGAFCRTDLDKMVQTIKLDDNQQAKIKPVIEQLKSKLKDAGSQIDSIDSDIKEQVNSPSMDESKVNSLVDKKANLIGAMMKAKLFAQHQIMGLLQPEQRNKLQALMAKEDEKMAAIYSKCAQD